MISEDDYIDAHIDAEPPALRALRRRTHLERLYPRMCTDHAQGRLLVMLTQLIKPRRILELGTFTGYSTLCLAEGMPEGCRIDTVEIDDVYADDLRRTLADSPRGADITLHIADAEALLPDLLARNAYDLVFIDANKRRYPEYLALISPALAPGSYILADNTLWADKVCDPEATDPQTLGIRRFNDLVAADPSLSVVILPVRDGLTLIRVL